MEQASVQKQSMKIYAQLFWSFFKLSPISFGGGFAMVPVLENEFVCRRKWINSEQMVDIFSLAQSAPGAIAVNSAIFIGYQIGGMIGAFTAMLGMVIPTFVIIIMLASLFVSFQHNHTVLAALNGIRPVVVALIASAAYKMAKKALVDKTCWAICAFCVAMLLFCPAVNIIFVILFGAFIGIVLQEVRIRLNFGVRQ
jgi:chromate transporter